MTNPQALELSQARPQFWMIGPQTIQQGPTRTGIDETSAIHNSTTPYYN